MKTSPIASSVLALSMFLALMLTSAALGDETVLHGRFVRLYDGDTIWVLVAEKQLEIRLAICVAPEKKQAFGARAKQAMSDLVFGKYIELGTHAIDRYGRTVAQVDVDGKDVGEEMLRQGIGMGLGPLYHRNIRRNSGHLSEIPGRGQSEQKEFVERSELNSAMDISGFNQGALRANDRHELDRSTPKVRRSEYSQSAACIASSLSVTVNSDDVWVNKKSGMYGKSGSPYYGKTKQGEYMSEKEAI